MAMEENQPTGPGSKNKKSALVWAFIGLSAAAVLGILLFTGIGEDTGTEEQVVRVQGPLQEVNVEEQTFTMSDVRLEREGPNAGRTEESYTLSWNGETEVGFNGNLFQRIKTRWPDYRIQSSDPAKHLQEVLPAEAIINATIEDSSTQNITFVNARVEDMIRQ